MLEQHQPSSPKRRQAIEWIIEIVDIYLNVKATNMLGYYLHQFVTLIYDYIQFKKNTNTDLGRFISDENNFLKLAALSLALSFYYIQKDPNIGKYYFKLPHWQQVLSETTKGLSLDNEMKFQLTSYFQGLLKLLQISPGLITPPAIMATHYSQSFSCTEQVHKLAILMLSDYCEGYSLFKNPPGPHLELLAVSALAASRHLNMGLNEPTEIWNDNMRSATNITWEKIQPFYNCFVEIGRPIITDFQEKQAISNYYGINLKQSSAWQSSRSDLYTWFLQIVPKLLQNNFLSEDGIDYITSAIASLKFSLVRSFRTQITFKMIQKLLLLDLAKPENKLMFSTIKENVHDEVNKCDDLSSLKVLLNSKMGMFQSFMSQENEIQVNHFLEKHYTRVSKFV